MKKNYCAFGWVLIVLWIISFGYNTYFTPNPILALLLFLLPVVSIMFFALSLAKEQRRLCNISGTIVSSLIIIYLVYIVLFGSIMFS